MERFLREVCTQEWNERQDAGRPFAQGIAELVARHPEHEPQIRAFQDRWPETLGGAIQGSVEIVGELRDRGYQLCALSNWSAETFVRVRETFSFFEWFHAIVISGEERVLKPDPRIYATVLARAGRRAEECVFVDDSATNVAAARALGFDGIVFTSPSALRSVLRDRELLP